MLRKALAWGFKGYWRTEKVREPPSPQAQAARLAYLRGELALSDEQLRKVLKAFPEALGLDVASRMQPNVVRPADAADGAGTTHVADVACVAARRRFWRARTGWRGPRWRRCWSASRRCWATRSTAPATAPASATAAGHGSKPP